MIRRWVAAVRCALGLNPPTDTCEVCGRKTKSPVKVIDRFDDIDGMGSAMVATFCEKHAPKETTNAT